jgi:hypothetical protein
MAKILPFSRMSSWHPPARLGSGPPRTVRLLLGRHRRPLAICLILAGLWITIRSAAPSPPATVAVLVATRDLPAGQTLTNNDVRSSNWPADHAPSGLLTAATGRTLAAPIRTGELVTDARVIGPGLLAGQPPGTVAMPVRLGDPAAGALVRAGDRVDVLVTSSSSLEAAAWSSEPDLADGTQPDRTTDPEGTSDPQGTADPKTGTNPGDGTDQGDSTGPTGNRSTTPTTSAGSASSGTESGGSGSGRSGSGAERVAAGALVLAVPRASSTDDGSWSGSTGGGLSGLAGGALPGATSGESTAAGLLVLALSASEARRLAAVQSGRYIGIVVLPQR